MRPIIVPAFTRDPTEKCLCIECYTRLVREGNKLVCPMGCDYEVLILAPSTRVDLGLGDSQAGEAQPGPGCPPGFQDYCVDEVGAACPSYREGHCAKAPEEEETP